MSTETDKPSREDIIRQLAKDEYYRDGEIEIDDNATISEGEDNGACVQAWVWVSFADTPLDKDHPTSNPITSMRISITKSREGQRSGWCSLNITHRTLGGLAIAVATQFWDVRGRPRLCCIGRTTSGRALLFACLWFAVVFHPVKTTSTP